MNRKILPKGFGEDRFRSRVCEISERGLKAGLQGIRTGLSGTMEFPGHVSNSKLSSLWFSNQVSSVCLMPALCLPPEGALLLLSPGFFPRFLCHLKAWVLSRPNGVVPLTDLYPLPSRLRAPSPPQGPTLLQNTGGRGVFTSRACVQFQGTQAESSSEQCEALCQVNNPEPWYLCWAVRTGKVTLVFHGT